MRKLYLICNEVNEPFVFELQNNEVTEKRYRDLKELFKKEKSDVDNIFESLNLEIYKTTSEVFEKSLTILCDPILLSPSGEQYKLEINSLIDMVEWSKLKTELLNVSSQTIIQNNFILVFEKTDDYNVAIAKWNNKKLI